MAQERQGGVLSRQLILSLYLPATMLSLGQSMVAPVLPGLAKSFDVGLTTASLVFVATSAGALLATFPAGYLMDKIGRRPVLLAGPMITAVASFMTPFSQSFVELLFWRFLIGVAAQLWQQGRLIVIADTAPKNQRARQMQWMTGVSRTGQLFGPAIGGFMAAGFGLWIPFALHAALTICAIIPSFKLIKETAPGQRGGRTEPSGEEPAAAGGEWRSLIAYLLTFQMITFLVVQLCATLARGGQDHGSLNLYAVYAYDVGPGTLGLLNTAAIAFGIPVPFLTGYLMDRFGRRAVIAPAFVAYASAVLLMSMTAFFTLPFEFFLCTYVLVQATSGATGGNMQVLGTDLSPPVGRGKFFGIWRLISQLGSTVTPAIYTFFAEHLGYGVGFLYLAGCALIVAFGVAVVLGDTMKRIDTGDPQGTPRQGAAAS
jgi:MFS family permease